MSSDQHTSSISNNDKIRLRILMCVVALIVCGTAIQLIGFHIPYAPSMFTTEFSTIMPLLASIAYGPLFGLLVCVAKYVFHMIIGNQLVISDFTNFAIEATFVCIAGVYYTYEKLKFEAEQMEIRQEAMRKQEKPQFTRFHRRKIIFTGCLIATIPTAILQFFVTNYLSYRLIEKYNGIPVSELLTYYQKSFESLKQALPGVISNVLPSINSIELGVLVYNLPITFAKLIIASLICTLLYQYISPYMHYRK